MSGAQNLIMGTWSRHGFWPLEPFVASLRRTAFNGDVCVFVDDVSPETVASLQSHGVTVERAGPSAPPRMTPLSGRFFNYLDFLAAHSERYANVMLTDLRDVVFQSDPFATPLPAAIVYAQERCRLGDSVENWKWVVQAYGEGVANNLRDYTVSCAGTTFGTTAGMLQYLSAMTRELSSRTVPIAGGIDQGIHNYVVHMHPRRNAWLDTTDAIVATMHFVPDASVRLSEQGVLIDDRLVPVLHQWDRNATTREYVTSAAQFRLAGLRSRSVPATDDAVVAFYHRERDAEWLPLFLSSLRCVGFTGPVHCVGAFDEAELQTLSRYGCTVHAVLPVTMDEAENVAHFYLAKLLDELAEGVARPDQVLVLDTMRAVFPRDPFAGKTIGLSAFSEGPTLIADSGYNLQRLAFFVPPDDRRLRNQVVSSALLRGPLDVLRTFYIKLLVEFAGRDDLLGIQKVIQGTINKVCHDVDLGFPVTVHPNGAEAYFDFWPSGLSIDRRQGVRVGGTVPSVVLGGFTESELLRALRINLGLPAP